MNSGDTSYQYVLVRSTRHYLRSSKRLVLGQQGPFIVRGTVCGTLSAYKQLNFLRLVRNSRQRFSTLALFYVETVMSRSVVSDLSPALNYLKRV